MAIATTTTVTPTFNTAIAAYHAARSLRAMCSDDDEQFERAEEGTMAMFELVVGSPANDLSAIISKLGAIMAEFGQGGVPAGLVEGVLMDLIAMERAA